MLKFTVTELSLMLYIKNLVDSEGEWHFVDMSA